MLFPIRDSIAPRTIPVVNIGLIVACCLAFLLQVFLGFFITVAVLPAVALLGVWFVLQLLEGALSLAAQPQAGGVAWFAHIGGFVAGVAVAW